MVVTLINVGLFVLYRSMPLACTTDPSEQGWLHVRWFTQLGPRRREFGANMRSVADNNEPRQPGTVWRRYT